MGLNDVSKRAGVMENIPQVLTFFLLSITDQKDVIGGGKYLLTHSYIILRPMAAHFSGKSFFELRFCKIIPLQLRS